MKYLKPFRKIAINQSDVDPEVKSLIQQQIDIYNKKEPDANLTLETYLAQHSSFIQSLTDQIKGGDINGAISDIQKDIVNY